MKDPSSPRDLIDASGGNIPSAAESSGSGEAVSVPRAMSGLGVCSVVCGLLSYLFPLTALFGIGAAVSGIMRDRRDWLCYVGLCLSLVMLIVNTVGMINACASGEMSALLGSEPSGTDI